jgi:heme exporter protein A
LSILPKAIVLMPAPFGGGQGGPEPCADSRAVAVPAGDGTGRAPYSEFRYDTPDDQRLGRHLSEPTTERAERQSGAGSGAGILRLVGTGLAARRGDRLVFENLSFSVGVGELLAITGPNGAGKSTTLRLIAGLVRPSAGTIAVEPSSEDGLPTQVHYLGHLDALKANLSLAENLDFWQRLWRGSGIAVERALDRVGLGDLADLPAGVLSAGQRRRAAIARLLLDRRPIWLLDEPTSALDAEAEATLGELIAEHLGSRGLAVAATHRPLPVAPTTTLALGRDA